MVKPCKECGKSAEHKLHVARCVDCERTRERLKHRKWVEMNPQRAREIRNKWRAGRIEREPNYIKDSRRRRRKKNPQTLAVACKRRIEWLKQGNVTKAELLSLIESSGSLCFYCKVKVRCSPRPDWPTGFDHVVPRARGGKHEISNMVVCCMQCNALKADKEVTLESALKEGK